MNTIREIQSLNKRELENNVSIGGSWHRDFDDTAYVYIGGLPFDLSEGDIMTIFSQYGEPVYMNLVRDKETGKSKGFAFLKYEDQRSTDLAVDNLGGATILGRTLKVDHTRYKRKDDDEEEARTAVFAGRDVKENDNEGYANVAESEAERPMLRKEKELAALIRDHDEDDPMKEYLVQEKREEVAQALADLKAKSRKLRHRKEKHHHKSHRHRSRRHSNSQSDEESRRHYRSQQKRSRSP